MTLPQKLSSSKKPHANSVQPKESLAEIFNEFAADALRDFPKLQDSFIFIDGKTGQAIGDVDPAKLHKAPQEIASIIAKEAAASQPPNGGYAETYPLNEETAQFEVIQGSVYVIRYNDYIDITNDAKKDIMFVLDHELGHAVVPNAHGSSMNYNEQAADVYAMLKYIQRNGDSDDVLTLLSRMRSESLIMGDLFHFSGPALQALEAQKGSLDIKNMTPSELTDKAAEIAEKTQYNAETVHDMENILTSMYASIAKRARVPMEFLPQVLPRIPFGELLKQIATQLCDSKVHASEFEMGMSILRPYMKDVPGHALPKGLEGPEWDMLKRSLLAKEQTVQPAPVVPKVKARLPKAFPVPEKKQVVEPVRQQWPLRSRPALG